MTLFLWIIKQNYKNKYFVTGDWSQSMRQTAGLVINSIIVDGYALRDGGSGLRFNDGLFM